MDESELKIIDVFIYKLRKQLRLACDGENLHRDLLGRAGMYARSR
jgi:hypothetical protein